MEKAVHTATALSFAVTVGLFVSLGLSLADLRQALEDEVAQTCAEDTPLTCQKG